MIGNLAEFLTMHVISRGVGSCILSVGRPIFLVPLLFSEQKPVCDVTVSTGLHVVLVT